MNDAAMNKRVLIPAIALLLICLGAGGYALYLATTGLPDTRIKTAIEAVQELHAYEMTVDTATVVSGRSMRISGLYTLDFDNNRYGSYGTTTLFTPDLDVHVHVFTLRNISITNDVYVKIDTESTLLRTTIPYSPEWRHFTADAIPAQFTNIAVSGPVLDTLALLGSGGTYLSPVGTPIDVQSGSSTMHVYAFKLASKASKVRGGTLQPLIQRIATGTVDILVDDASAIRGVVVTSDNYVSTTTIVSVNTHVEVTPPATAE